MTMVEIGQMLKEAREKKSLTIDQAQKQTRIHSRVLIALEEGKCEDILSAAYVKSFLRKYSGYLGLDSDAILKLYAAAHSRPAASTPAVNTPPARDSMDEPTPGHRLEAAARAANFTKFIFAVLSLVLIIALLFLGTLLWRKAIRSMAKPKVASAARPPRLSGGAKPGRAAYQKKPKAAAPSRQKKDVKKASKDTPFHLAIRVKEPVLIQLKKDGALLFKRVLSKGDVESFRVNKTANIYVAKAEAIELILDGRVLNVPARGIVKNLEVTRDGVEIR